MKTRCKHTTRSTYASAMFIKSSGEGRCRISIATQNYEEFILAIQLKSSSPLQYPPILLHPPPSSSFLSMKQRPHPSKPSAHALELMRTNPPSLRQPPNLLSPTRIHHLPNLSPFTLATQRRSSLIKRTARRALPNHICVHQNISTRLRERRLLIDPVTIICRPSNREEHIRFLAESFEGVCGG